MIYRVTRFEPHHFHLMEVQEEQVFLLRLGQDPAYLEAIASLPNSYTMMFGNQPLGCGGVFPIWEGRYQAWAVLSKHSGPHMMAITREVRYFFKHHMMPRVEISVGCDFPAAHRWARILGFTCEAERMISYGPDGGDYALYART